MPSWYWILALCVLWISTCGIWMTFVPLLMIISFICGVFMRPFCKTKFSLSEIHANLTTELTITSGIRKLLEGSSNKKLKMDKRLTGSHQIDEGLQAIITYLVRDYIYAWYSKISADDEFLQHITSILQQAIIDVASKVKDVNWIHYLTTRLVDDATTHLKCYRLVCEKIKAEAEKKSIPRSLASFKSETEGNHSRSSSDGTSIKTHSRNSSIGDKPADFETLFFRVEADQDIILSHAQLCTNRNAEKNYFNDVVDVILYMLLPLEQFQCLPARFLLREIIVGGVLQPIIDVLSEPDCINRFIVQLCSGIGVTSDALLITLKLTAERNEILAISEFANKQISFLRTRDVSNDNELLKLQLKGLMYIKKKIDNRLHGSNQSNEIVPREKLVLLPVSVILSNSLALSYFIDYLNSIDKQKYIFLYLAIENWKSSIIAEGQKNDGRMTKSQIAGIREAATIIYQQFLSEKAAGHIKLDQSQEARFLTRLTHEPPNKTWFDEVQGFIIKRLTDHILPDFYHCSIYLKLLSELELLKDGEESPDCLSLSGSVEEEETTPLSKKHEKLGLGKRLTPDVGVGRFNLKVDIIDCGVVQDRGKTYGMYALNVVKTYENGHVKQWHVYRRYSDFYDLQQKIKDEYDDLGKLPFPGKKTFNNMAAITLAKRMKMLNNYLQILLHSGVAETHPRLPVLLLAFLEPGDYDKAFTFGSAFESMVGPIKSSMRSVTAAVKTVPDTLFHSSDSRRKEIRDESFPVRILMQLMDEVFDLQHRNQWLRRRIVTLLRQIFGDILTRKLLVHVEELTGEARIAGYINSVKELMWPNGARSTGYQERDEACKLRTRVLAKASLITAADDFKHVLGSETTRRGLLRVFNTFQYAGINRRLVHVLLEGGLQLIFPPLTDLHAKLLQKQRNHRS